MTPKPKAVSNKRRRSSSEGPQKRQRSQKSKDEQLSKPGKVVSANNLNWNSVKISKSIDVVEGFFGLEEIEGVDVKYIDGQARFVVKDDSKVKAEEEHDSTKVKKNTSLLTKEEEAELEKQDKERSLKRVDTIKQKTDKKKIQEGELLKQDDEEDEEEEFTGFSDGEHEEDAVATQQPLTILSDDEEIKDGGSKPESEDEIDEDLLEDYKENLHSNQLTNIIDEDDDINSVQLDPEFVENWSDRSLSRYTLNALSKLNFKVPTEVQKQCIPVAIGNHDIIGKASTGSGKTLAYGVPLLERFLLRLKENENKPLSAPVGIIFTPTRELAKQVYNHLINVVEHYPLKNPKSLIVSITGGLSIQKQERLLTYNPGVIIATPGRLLEIIEMDNNDILNKLSKIEMLTLDEADRLLQDGHFGEMEKIIEVLNKIRMQNHYKKWQTLVFSATFSKDLFHKLDKNIKKNTDGKKTKSKKAPKKNKFPMTESITDDSEIISFLKTKLQFKDKEPKLVNVNPKEIVSGTISEALIECDGTSRDLYLYYFLIMYTGSTLIFTNSIDSVKRLNSFLKFLNIRAYSIHSSMMQKQRLKNLENFQKSCAHVKGSSTKKETVVLIATDVAARGLDIPNIDHVVHYHLPRSADLYIHRSGRTGRAGNEGVSIMLCSPQEAGGPLRRLRTLIMDESMKMEKKALKQNSKDKVFDKALLSKFQHLNDDVKLLPIEVSILDQLKERSDIATELAESDVSKHSLSKEDSWVSKLAKDLEVDDISDFEDETLRKNRNKKQNKTLDSRVLQEKKFQLNKLLKEKLRFGAGSRKYISNGSLNMADVILKGKGHDNIVGYNSVDVIDVIKKSRNHQDRLQRLQEQKEAQKDKIKERKLNKDKKKDARKDVKRKKLEKTFGNGGNADDDDDDDYEDEDEE